MGWNMAKLTTGGLEVDAVGRIVLTGRIYYEDGWWAAEVPALRGEANSRTRDGEDGCPGIIEMLRDWVSCQAVEPGLRVDITEVGDSRVEIRTSDDRALLGAVLGQTVLHSDIGHDAAAAKLGITSDRLKALYAGNGGTDDLIQAISAIDDSWELVARTGLAS